MELSGGEVTLATWSHAGFGAKQAKLRADKKIEYVSCNGDACEKLCFTPLPTDGGRTFKPSAALVLRLITQPAACAFLPLAGLLCFIVFVPTVPGDALAALLDSPFASGAQLCVWAWRLLLAAHCLEAALATAVLLSPPLSAPLSAVLAWAPLVLVVGFPVTSKVLKLRSAEVRAKRRA